MPLVRFWPFSRAWEIVIMRTSPPSQPILRHLLHEHLASLVGALLVGGDDEGDVVALVGADVGDDDRNVVFGG